MVKFVGCEKHLYALPKAQFSKWRLVFELNEYLDLGSVGIPSRYYSLQVRSWYEDTCVGSGVLYFAPTPLEAACPVGVIACIEITVNHEI